MSLVVLLYALQVALQLVSLVNAVGLYRRLCNWFYLPMIVAFALMAVRRVTAWRLLDSANTGLAQIDGLVLPLSISVLLAISLTFMYRHVSNK